MNELVVFAKHWQAGTVKTRLAADLGDTVASDLYHGFLIAIAGRWQHVGDGRTIAYAPVDAEDAFRRLTASMDWKLAPQSPGDLGARLAHRIRATVAAGAERVVVLGSDSPSLPTEVIDDAFRRLDRHDLVIGPAQDGGYYLLGVTGCHDSLFHDIDWSSDRVFEQTIARARALSPTVRFDLLTPWFDVDHAADLRRLHAEIAATTDPWLSELAARISRALQL